MSTSPNYAGSPKVGIGQISTANTARDGTGTTSVVFTAGTSGSRIERVVVTATGTTTAGMVRLFLNNGTTSYLYCEMVITAITPSGNLGAFNGTFEAVTTPSLFPLVLPTGWSLRACTNNAETFNVMALGGDF